MYTTLNVYYFIFHASLRQRVKIEAAIRPCNLLCLNLHLKDNQQLFSLFNVNSNHNLVEIISYLNYRPPIQQKSFDVSRSSVVDNDT